MIEMEKYLADLSPEKQKLFKLLMQEKQAEEIASQTIPKQKPSEQDTFPLSFAQQRLWFLDQWEPGNPAYNLLQALRLNGRLDVAILERCLNDIVARHEILRTVFVTRHGQPQQQVLPKRPVQLVQVDLSEARETAVQAYAAQTACEPFDLTNGPLIRFTLLHLKPTEYVLLLTMHHIISDGWSNGVLLREVGELYQAYTAEREPTLPDLPIQYSDFAFWQREWMQGQILEEQLTYWQAQLKDAKTILNLPTDYQRPANLTYIGARHYFSLPIQLTNQLRELSQKEGASLFMTLLAVFNVLLYRYTNQEDILVGSPIANRNRAEIERLIGFFVNTLVLRTNLSGNPTFRQLLQRVRQTTLSAYSHQDLPFERLVEEMQLERDMSHSPLFQVVFVLQSAPLPTIKAPSLTLKPLEIDNGTTQFDITLELYEFEGTLRGSFQYNTDLFKADTIARFEHHFQMLLTHVTSNPDLTLPDIPLLTESTRQQILFEWNETQTSYTTDQCLHQLVESQVARTPQATAVVGPDGDHMVTLTYQQINERSNQIAHYLKQQGVTPGTNVAIYLTRSIDMVTALLGILKAGGSYIPLEISLPPDRVAWIVSFLQVEYLLTHSEHTARLLEMPSLKHLICLDTPENTPYQGWANIRSMPDTNLDTAVTSNHIAYTIFTSGSTGAPKGVFVRHQPVVNLIEWVNKTFDVGVKDRLLFITSPSFDLSVYDIFGILACGGSIRVASQAELEEPEQLLKVMTTEPITFWDSAPAALRQLTPFLRNLKEEAMVDTLRLAFLSGDWIPVTLPNTMRNAFPNLQVVSLGGATEATIWSNFHKIETMPEEWISIPYGRPIQNARYYILDSRLEPCLIGVPGDLYIGGDCLADGYANAPHLTADRFIPDPYNSQKDGATMYRTGDRARFWADGTMEFLGRLDHQVKVRGFRIELGEIESVLSQHPAVQDVIVMAHETNAITHDKFLVAYIVPKAEVSVETLRSHLMIKLPDYMIPSFFLMLEAIPVTSNGKVNRKVLPVPERQADRSTIYATPRNSFEDTIAGIWVDVLELDRVGVHDNFFEIGGHSLLATQIMARIQDAYQIELPLRILFDKPTVAQMATAVQIAREEKQGLQTPPIVSVINEFDHFPLSLAQERIWLIDQLVPGNTAYISPGAARLRGLFDINVLEKSFQEVMRRHAIFRTNFFSDTGKPIQVIGDEREIGLNLVDLRHLPEAERLDEAIKQGVKQAQISFDLTQGPLIRMSLYQLGEQDYFLALATHHIIYDLMSIGILVREMQALYEAFSQNLPSPLPDLAIQYADFSYWQQTWVCQSIIDTQLPYWIEQLKDAPSVLELPTDYPRPVMQTFNGSRYPLHVPLDMTNSIKKISQEEGTTLFMTLLAVFKVLLYRYTGQEDLIVGTPITTRNRSEIEAVMGFFVNILALRSQISGHMTFREVLQQVREVALGAYMHQDLPFAALVEEVQPERDLSRNPLFQVVFNFLHNYMMPMSNENGLEMDFVRIHAEAEQFDLALDFWERPDGFRGSFDYSTDIFAYSTIERMAGHLFALMRAVIADPDKPIADLTMLTDTEKNQVLMEWRSTDGEETAVSPVFVHTQISRQAEKTPAAIALMVEDATLTYVELDQQANRLAHYLQGLGVGAEVKVGVSLARSFEAIIAMLAVYKAGGVYVPIAPDYPEERFHYIVTDAELAVLITRDEKAFPTTKVISFDSVPLSQQPDTPPFVTIAGENLAYIIYTSGSTGQPKGVSISYDALAKHIQNSVQHYQLTRQDAILQFAVFSFDASLEQLLSVLTVGGKLVLRDEEIWDAVRFKQRADQYQLTVINVPPAYWHLLVQQWVTDPHLVPALRLIIVGGDMMSPETVRLWLQLEKYDICLLNAYGPTETTITATTFDVNQYDAAALSWRIPIGRPLPQRQVLILDADGNPVPTGIAGELYIGGESLARGYLNQPALTAEKFVPHPFSDESGARLYRTGDLVRFLPDGNIEFMERIDNQVKIRGFRIELGEIEAVLKQCKGVLDVAVILREDIPNEKYLAAYLVMQPDYIVIPGDLHDLLSDRLPHYMIPTAFVTLAAIPLTGNGKLNIRALPKPQEGETTSTTLFMPPRDVIEEVLAGICAELLSKDEIGIYDSFFELGGHSLLATQLISQVREFFYVDLPLAQLFKEPTVAGLAQNLRQHSGKENQIVETAELLLKLAQIDDEDVEEMLED